MSQADEHNLQLCLEFFRKKIQKDSALSREMESARMEFLGAAKAESEIEERRFFEWFCFERISQTHGEPAAMTYLDDLQDTAPEHQQDFVSQILDQTFGFFEIQESSPEAGVLVRDLLSQREFWMRSDADNLNWREGDLLIGRVFADGSGSMFVSESSKRLFRNDELKEALARDLLEARKTHSGNRVSQLEIEKLFRAQPKVARSGHGAEDLSKKWKELVERSIPEFSYSAIAKKFQEAKNPSEIVTQILDRLAFETEVDLNEARLILLAMLSNRNAPKPETTTTTTAPVKANPQKCVCGSEMDYADCCQSKDALNRFESARAQGGNVESLFETLERDLGIDETGEDGESDLIPSESEIEPIVEEYIWERVSSKKTDSTESLESEIALIKSFAKFIENDFSPPTSHFDEVDSRHLVQFFAVHLIESPEGRKPQTFKNAFHALERFVAWSDHEQGTELTAKLQVLIEKLQPELSRLARANAQLKSPAAKSTKTQLYRILALDEAQRSVEIERLDGKSKDLTVERISLPNDLIHELRVRDLMKTVHVAGANEPVTIYPAAAELFVRN